MRLGTTCKLLLALLTILCGASFSHWAEAGSVGVNFSFEAPVENGAIPGWSLYGNASLSREVALSTDNVFEGAQSIRIADDSSKAAYGVRSAFMPATAGAMYVAAARVWKVSGQPQIYLEFWNQAGKRIGTAFTGNSAGPNQWSILSIQGTAPPDTASLTVLLYSHAANTGVAYFDLVEVNQLAVAQNTFSGTRQDADWAHKLPRQNAAAGLKAGFLIKETGHPRLFFTQAELDQLKQRLADTTNATPAMRTAAQQLLNQAADYLDERSFSITYYDNHVVTFPLPPKQPDYIPNPPTYTGGRYPYWTMMSRAIEERLETLSLAYAISGDAKYGRKAISLALALADWNEWTDKTYSCGNSCLDTAHFTLGMATTYDMTYPLLTDTEREIMRKAIQEKGLRWLNADTGQRSDNNLHMLRTSGLGAGALALLGDVPGMEAYVARAYDNFFWYLDQRMDSGQTEGMTYTSYAMDYVSRFGDALMRVTGNSDFLDHPYIAHVLPQWAAYFLAPGGKGQVNFSDSSLSNYYYTTMALYRLYRHNALVDWYMQESNLQGGPWGDLLYSGTDGQPQSPSEFGLPTSRAFWDIGWVALRSGWTKQDHLLAFQSSRSKLGHNQLDQNNFVLNVGGDWLITDPGYPDYSPGPRNQMTKQTIGHNALLVDGNGQVSLGEGRLLEFFHSPAYDFTTGEAGQAYAAHGVTGWERKILYSRPDYFIIVDRVSSYKPILPELLFHTSTDAVFAVGGSLRRPGDVVDDPTFRIAKSAGMVDGIVLHPKGVQLTYTIMPGAESYGPYVRVAPQEASQATTFVTLLRPKTYDVTSPFSATSIEKDGLVWLTVRVGTEVEYTMLNPERKGGLHNNENAAMTVAGDHGVLRLGQDGTILAYSLGNGTALHGSEHRVLISAEHPITASVTLSAMGSQATIWAEHPTAVKLWSPLPQAVYVNGVMLDTDQYTYDPGTGLLSINIDQGDTIISLR